MSCQCTYVVDLVSELASSIKSVICYNENYYIDTGALIELLRCESDDDIDQYLLEQGEFYNKALGSCTFCCMSRLERKWSHQVGRNTIKKVFKQI